MHKYRSLVDSVPWQVIMEYWVEFFVLDSRFLLVTYVIYSIVYMAVPISQFFPPPTRPHDNLKFVLYIYFWRVYFLCVSLFLFCK